MKVGLKGFVEVIVERDGEVIYHDTGENTWVQTGVQEVVNWLIGSTATPPAYLGIGTDSTAADQTQTALLAELDYATYTTGGGRIAATTTTETTTFTNDTAVFTGTFEFQGTPPTIAEMGLFNAATAGTMFARRTMNFTPEAGDKLTINWKLQLEIL